MPVADAQAQRDQAKEVRVSVSSEGAYSINHVPLAERSAEALASALLEAAKAGKESVLIINADASARHQAVVTVMEAARRAGLTQITFTAQTSARAGTP